MAKAFAQSAVLGPIPLPRLLLASCAHQENSNLPLNRALVRLVRKENMLVPAETPNVLTVLSANTTMPPCKPLVLTALLVSLPAVQVHSCAQAVLRASIRVPMLVVASLAPLGSTLVVRVKLNVKAASVVPIPLVVSGHAPLVLLVSSKPLVASPLVLIHPRALIPPLVPLLCQLVLRARTLISLDKGLALSVLLAPSSI